MSAARARSRRGDGESLRDEILDAADALLQRVGDEAAVSIRGIADAVGVTAPSIYLHFADKQELIFAVCERHFAALDALVEHEVAGIDDPLARVAVRGRAYVRFGLDNQPAYRILFMGGAHDTPDAFTPERMEQAACLGRLVDDVRLCIDSGQLEQADPWTVSIGLWATTHGIVSLLISKPSFPWPDVESLVDLVIGAMGRGLSPQPALKLS